MSYTAILFAVVAFWVGSELVISVKRRSDAASTSRQDRRSLTFLWVCMAIGPALGGILTGMRFAEMPAAMRPYAFWGGLAAIVAGVVIRYIAIATLKRFFTVDVAIAKDHKVIDHGLYSVVRHPSYAGTLLSSIGLGFAFCNWLSLAACAIFAIAGLSFRIAVEEQALLAALGEDYRAYSARTKRLIPGVF